MEQKRNIVLIMTDQQRWDTIAAQGYDYMHTPGMDRLVKNGVSFRNAYCPGATCVASRAAIFTGYYPHNTGVYGFNPWAHRRNWIQDLAEGGYWCANVGKMHFIPYFADGGFHERIVVENPTSPPVRAGFADDDWGHYLKLHGVERPMDRHRDDPHWHAKHQSVPWEYEEHLHSDVFIGNSAVAWVNSYNKDQPFFLQVGLTGPHEPYDPLPRHLDHYRDTNIPQPVWRDGELDKKPPQQQAFQDYFGKAEGEASVDMKGSSMEDLKKMRRHYFAKITTVDEQVSKVLDALEKRGFLENSVVIFCSDHGDMVGDHKLTYKWLMYDPVVHVPLIIYDPEMYGSANCAVQGKVNLMDLGPTILDYAGVEIPEGLEGRSLRPALNPDISFEGESYVFCENNYLTMIRGDDWKLIHYAGQTYGELYDLKRDPNELENLWDDPESAAEKDRLLHELFEWHIASTYRSAPFLHGESRKISRLLPEKTLRLH